MYHKTIKHDAEECLLRTIMKYITNVFDFILVFIATKPIYSVIELDSAAIVLRSVYIKTCMHLHSHTPHKPHYIRSYCA